MKKNVLVSAAVLALGVGSMFLTGFDSAATVDDVIANYTEASSNVDGLSAAADIDMKMTLGIAYEDAGASMNLDMSFDGTMDIKCIKDPLTVGVAADFNVSAMGEEMKMNLQTYMVPGDDGAWDAFTYVDDGTGGVWEYEAVPADQMEELQKLMDEAQLDPGKLPIEYTMSDEPTDVNGSACYHLATSITYDVLKPIMEEAMAAASTEDQDETTMAIAESMLSGMVFNMEMDVDAESYLPLKATMNMDGSDFSEFSQMMGFAFATTDEDGNDVIPEVTLEIPTMVMDFTYDYSAPSEILVPAEALEAKENPGTSQDLDDIEAIAEDTLAELEADAE